MHTEPLVHCSLHRNYVSYLIPMAIFNMAIQVFVVMSSYQSIAQKFKKTGNPRVSRKRLNTRTELNQRHKGYTHFKLSKETERGIYQLF